jgi:hypothetical protein
MNGNQHGRGKFTLSNALATSGRTYDKRKKECSGNSQMNLWLSEEQSKDGKAMADGCEWLNYDL